MKDDNLAQVIILYGPPGAGKGTQAARLRKMLPDYYHLDFGTEIRGYIKENYTNSDESNPEYARAKTVKEMTSLGPIETEDLRYIVESKINQNIEQGKGMIIEGPGRLIEEAKWLSGYFAENKLEVAILHMHVDIEEVVSRSTSRYYIPSSKEPYISYQEAKSECLEGEEPYQREEDKDTHKIISRYKSLYAEQWAEILSIYQLQAKTKVFTVNGDKSIEKVTEDIKSYLNTFYSFDL